MAATSPDMPQRKASLTNGGVNLGNEDIGVEAGMQGMKLNGGVEVQGELHRACAEGSLEDVRRELSKGLEALESLDSSTGSTPIVLAIRHNHPDVVRELLSAGAIVPPPGITSDPLILSLLYPQPLYFQHEYYPQPPPFFDPRSQSQQPRRDGTTDSTPPITPTSPNLPPAEVSKTIPCRNFPNCKYGSGCVFYHPKPQSGFFPPSFGYEYPPFQGYYPMGYPPFPPPPSFEPRAQGDFIPQAQNGSAQSPPNFQHQQHPGISQASHQQFTPGLPGNHNIQHEQSHDFNSDSVPPTNEGQGRGEQAVAPLGIPNGGAPVPNGHHDPLSPTSTAFSPSVLGASLPSIPPADAFFATSPPAATMIPNGVSPYVTGSGPMATMIPPSAFQAPSGLPPNRRQSFNTPFGGMPIKPFGHAKKPSFSGGPRPFGSRGPPPPCAFFGQNKCRNGEFCKFPHLDAEGNDCRHPDVVRGLIRPVPTPARRHPMGPGFGYPPFAEGFQRGSRPPANLNHSPTINEYHQPNGDGNESVPTSPPTEDISQSTPSLPAKPTAPTPPTFTRSASQPGIQRVHANGVSSRSLSPAASTASHGAHPRRRPENKSAPAPAPQRIPGADEFPALNGTGKREAGGPKWESSRTAAQVLSQPAANKQEEELDVEVDSEDSDAVVISLKPPSSSSRAASERRSSENAMSFANAATASAVTVEPSMA